MRKALYAMATLAALPPWAAVAPPAGLTAVITAPANEAPAFALRAEGVHVFECATLAGSPDRYAWSFTAPDATLYDAGRPVARQVTGNTFEALSDRSTVAGVVRGRQDGGANNLPWLLMRAQSTPDAGLFAGVTSIQRVNTTGGAAPVEGCNDTNVGKEARVPFAAEYYFYRPAG
jgi:hypothetical protein